MRRAAYQAATFAAMRLYRFEYSCYARFVQATLDLAGAAYHVVEVPFGDRDELVTLTGGYVQVPVLVTDAGAVIPDSRRIVATLVAEDPRFAALVPAGDAGPIWAYVDWAASGLEDVAFRLASPGLRRRFKKPFERALFTFVKERKFGAGCVDAWERDADGLFDRLVELLAPTVATLGSRAFLFGAAPTLADAALYGQLVMLDFGAPDRVAALSPTLLAWRRRLEARLGAAPYGRPAREHRTIAAIEEAHARVAAAPRSGALELIVVRDRVNTRDVPASATVEPGRGLAGDHWVPLGAAEDEISIMDVRVAAAIADRDDWPLFGDNLFVDLPVGEAELAAGDRLAIGDVLLEITAYPHLGCRKFMARFGPEALRWVNGKPQRPLRRRGVYAKVIAGGTIRAGDRIEVRRG
jgi:glutathione S-transferase